MSERRWGHVKLSRKAYAEDPFWLQPRVFSKWEAWLDCIYMAAWKPRKFAIGVRVEELERGEFMASIRYLAERWKWDKMTVSRFLDEIEKCGRLQRQRKVRGGSVYLLVNYEHYQGNEPTPETRRETPRETPERQRRDKTEAVKQLSKDTWLTPFAELWQRRCGNPPFGKLATVLAPLVKEHEAPEVLARWSRYLDGTDPKFCSVHRFAETFGAWAPPSECEMTDEFGRMVLHRRNASGEWQAVS